MSVRYLTEKDQERYKELSYYCFYDDTWEWDSPYWQIHFNNTPWEDCLGYEEDGVIESTWMTMNLPMFIRGKLMDISAVYGVTTSPEQRRKGHVRKLLVESLKHMREKEHYISALYPFKHSYYRRFGYETCNTMMALQGDPKNIRLPKGFKPLKITEISKEDSYEYVKEFRSRIGSKFNLVMFNHEREWRFFKLWERSKLYAIHDGDKMVGYFIARLERENRKQNLKAFEVLTETIEARYTWLDFVKKHSDQVKEFIWPLMGDEVVSEYFSELWGSGVQRKSMGGSMLRIVDARKILESIDYPDDLDVSLTLQVTDEYAPWNNEPFTLTISNGMGKTKPVSGEVDAQFEVGGLTQLVVGFVGIQHLVDHRRAEVRTDLIQVLEKAFPKRYTRILTDF